MSIHELLIVASHDGQIGAIDGPDGSSCWTRNCAHPFSGPALVQVGDMVIAVALDGYLCAMALADGTIRWEEMLASAFSSADAVGPTRLAEPLISLRVAANEECCAVQLGNRVFGVDTQDGHVTWEAAPAFTARRWWLLGVGQERMYFLQAEAVQGVNLPVFVTTAFSTWDGAPQWWAPNDLSAGAPPWDGASSLVEANDIVYLYGRQGLHALEAKSGTAIWTNANVPRHSIGALAVAQDQVIVAAQGHFGVYRRDTGAPLWSLSGERQADGSFEIFDNPLVIGDEVYVGHRQSTPAEGVFHMEAYRSATGGLQWKWPKISASSDTLHPDVSWRFRGAGATLYVPSQDTIWGIHAIDGSERWHIPYPLGFSALLAVSSEGQTGSEPIELP